MIIIFILKYPDSAVINRKTRLLIKQRHKKKLQNYFNHAVMATNLISRAPTSRHKHIQSPFNYSIATKMFPPCLFFSFCSIESNYKNHKIKIKSIEFGYPFLLFLPIIQICLFPSEGNVDYTSDKMVEKR